LFSFDLAGVKPVGQGEDMEDRVLERYAVRPAEDGFRIVDVWTGQTVKIASVAQDDLSEADAAHTAKMLNNRVAKGERKVLE
jgi:hypothetical protein